MRRALIGYSGFVGQNLARQAEFTDFFNSKNFHELRGQYFDLLVCAGASAAKWIANQNPEDDRNRILALVDVLSSVQAEHVVLISTIDVYPILIGANEDYDCHSVPNHPYGANRLLLEDFVCEHFDAVTVVRLPGLFGPGIKKNVIYDLLHGNCLDKINADSSFQWYGLNRLWGDVLVLMREGVRMANLFPEPMVTSRLLALFPQVNVGSNASPIVRYDLQTKFGALFGGKNGYMISEEEVFKDVQIFIRHQLSVR